MSRQRYTPELKGEAVKLISERRYSVTDVAEYLGISQHSIYKMWTPIKSGTELSAPLKKSTHKNSDLRHCWRRLQGIDKACYLTTNRVFHIHRNCLLAGMLRIIRVIQG